LTLSQLDVVDEVLCSLRDLGVRLALDDFVPAIVVGHAGPGAGPRVEDRPGVHRGDGRFGGGGGGPVDHRAGSQLDLLVVAEGVESEEQRSRLWELAARPVRGTCSPGRCDPPAAGRTAPGLRRKPATLAAPLWESGSVIRLPARRRSLRRRDELG